MLIHNVPLSFFTTCLSVGFTNKVPSWRGVPILCPACGPGHQDGVVLHSSQSRRLDEQRETISQVGRHHHMGEALCALGSHGCFQVLQNPSTHGGNRVVSGAANEVRMSLKELLMNPSSPWTSQLHLSSTSRVDQCNLKLKHMTTRTERKVGGMILKRTQFPHTSTHLFQRVGPQWENVPNQTCSLFRYS